MSDEEIIRRIYELVPPSATDIRRAKRAAMNFCSSWLDPTSLRSSRQYGQEGSVMPGPEEEA
jgi:hypothetical protein